MPGCTFAPFAASPLHAAQETGRDPTAGGALLYFFYCGECSVLGVAWSPVRPWPMRQPAPLGAHAHDQAMVLLPVQKLLLVQPQHRRETQQEPRGSSAAWSDIWWSSAVGKYASDSSDREVRQLPWLNLHFVLYARTSPALSVALLQTARCGHCFICSGCRRLPFLAGAHRHLHQGRRDCSRFHYRQSRTCL